MSDPLIDTRERWSCGCVKGITPHGAGWADCIFTDEDRARIEARDVFLTEIPRGWRCWLFRHPWRWSVPELYLRIGLSFKVCTKDGCCG